MPNQTYQKHRAEGRCGKCGAEDERTRRGLAYCERCASKYRAEYSAVRVCRDCGTDISDRRNATYCLDCAKRRDSQRQRIRRGLTPTVIKRYVPPERHGLSLADCAKIDRFYGISYGEAEKQGLHTEEVLSKIGKGI